MFKICTITQISREYCSKVQLETWTFLTCEYLITPHSSLVVSKSVAYVAFQQKTIYMGAWEIAWIFNWASLWCQSSRNHEFRWHYLIVLHFHSELNLCNIWFWHCKSIDRIWHSVFNTLSKNQNRIRYLEWSTQKMLSGKRNNYNNGVKWQHWGRISDELKVQSGVRQGGI